MGRRDIDGAVSDDADRAEHADVGDARQLARRRQAAPQPALDPRDILAPDAAEKQLRRGQRRSARQRVAHVRRTVQQRAWLRSPVASATASAQRCRERAVAAREKISALREALEGRFEANHALIVGAILAHPDVLDEQIARLSDAIEAELGTRQAGVTLASTITDVAQRTAEVIVAEIGTDMTVFPTAGHLASWAGRCPGNPESAGKRRSGRTRSKFLTVPLHEAALAATRVTAATPQAQYQRLRPRIGHRRGMGAVMHSILIAYWHMFNSGESYRDLGSELQRPRRSARQITRFVARLERLVETVTLSRGARLTPT